jgi:hypothetical protein
MKIVLTLCLLTATGMALTLSSCCCTGETAAPSLRRMPHFKPLPPAEVVVTQEVTVTPAK